MHIALRNITYCEALSIDSTAYAAEVWIDGTLAFRVRNHGSGGSDVIERSGRWREEDVNRWLGSNRPPLQVNGAPFAFDLECEVSRLLARYLERGRLLALIQTHLVTIEQDRTYHYSLRRYARDKVENAVRSANPDAIVVDGTDDAILDQAIDLIMKDLDRD